MAKEIETSGKVHMVVINFVRVLLVVAFLGALRNNRPLVLFISALAFFVTFLPVILEKKWGVRIPAEFEVITLLFIYGSLFFGEVRGFYATYWWWDSLLNLVASMALGFVGLTILYVLYKEEKLGASPFIIAFFTFCFALALVTVWEIFEFAMDYFMQFNFQKSLIDTMGDIIVGGIGALFVSIAGYIYMKEGKKNFISKLIISFIDKNPLLFKSVRRERPDEKIFRLIKKGESDNLEFKSTLRTNLHINDFDKKIEHATLKTIVAYLNSKGGILLVGVNDEGEVIGIEKDNFQTNDKLNLHFTNLLKNTIGNQYLPLINFELVKIDGKHVLRIDCKKSDRPVFLKVDEEEFFIRNGPSSVKLTGSELVNYIERRFKKE